MFKRMMMAMALLALTVPTTAWAANENLEFYDALAGQGNTRILGPVSGMMLDLDYLPGTQDFGEFGSILPNGEPGIFGWSSITLVTTGDVTLDAFSCQAVPCTPNLTKPGTVDAQLSATGGNNTTGETRSGGPYDFGMLTISGTNGTVQLIAGNSYLEADVATVSSVAPFTLAQVVIPEPGTLVLLGAGLAGLAFLRRRSA